MLIQKTHLTIIDFFFTAYVVSVYSSRILAPKLALSSFLKIFSNSFRMYFLYLKMILYFSPDLNIFLWWSIFIVYICFIYFIYVWQPRYCVHTGRYFNQKSEKYIFHDSLLNVHSWPLSAFVAANFVVVLSGADHFPLPDVGE